MNDKPDEISIAAQLIQHYESCILAPYPDPRGIPTIGWGNTRYENGTLVTMADPPLTQDQADALFRYWLLHFAGWVRGALTRAAIPCELGAFISLAYDIGMGNFSISLVLKHHNEADEVDVGAAFDLWNRAGGQILKGLLRRRRAEHLVFDGEDVASAIAQAEQDFP